MENTSTDWQALCAELVEALEEWARGQGTGVDAPLLTRARAALAQPEPEGLPAGYIDAEHTGHDREMLEVFYRACRSEGGTADEIHLRGLHAVLAHWDRLSIEPVPVTERLPKPEDCDAEGRCWLWDSYENMWDLVNLECRVRAEFPHSTHWLPYIAIPTPTREEI